VYLTKYDVKRLEMYSNNLVDYHLIMDLVPALARLYFLNHMGDTHLSAVQSVSFLLVYIIKTILFSYRFKYRAVCNKRNSLKRHEYAEHQKWKRGV